MKAVILTLPVLMMAFLLGCTEQSQMTGPTTTASNAIEAKVNNDIFDNVKFEKMVAGPGGTKYFVSGSVGYTLIFNGKVYSLSTTLNTTINQSGGDNSWVVLSTKQFKSVVNDKGVAIVSESNDFGYIKTLPRYRLTLEYTIENDVIAVTDIKVVYAKVVDVTTTPAAKVNGGIEGSAKFEKMVVGPGGISYYVVGMVDYTLSFDGNDYMLTTSMNTSINQFGLIDKSWVISSEKSFKSALTKEVNDNVSESNDFEYIAKKFPLYRLTLEYAVDNNGVTVKDVKITNAKVVDGVKTVD